MNKVAVLLLMVMTALVAVAQTTTLPADSTLSPAERSMAQANRLIEKNPRNFEAYNALALAFSRRARETSDVRFYAQAEETLKTSFEISPSNFDGEKIHVWLLLGRHEFTAAREEARKLNKKMPDDVMVYGFLTDANIELGNYKEAEDSAQLMLDIRPGNLPGLTRAAYLRELFGDIDGSVELMNMAYQSTPPSEAEDRAWILSQIAHLKLMSGKIADADNTLQQALTIFPGYHYALGNLAKVRIEQKRYEDAVKILQQRYASAQHAENLYDLAEALELAGHRDQAQKAFGEFETKSRLESVYADNSNRELIFYYADHAHQASKALEVAQAEYARRRDVFTLDAYAWALHVNGRDSEARSQIAAALAVGIRDAKMLRHAGEIALSTGDRATAERYLLDSTKMNAPGSSEARELLASLSASTKN
jgi:tetratricopeptide (TPR) repeat protein